MIQILLALLLLVLILGLAILAAIYIPLMPLFIQAWLVEIFGDVDAQFLIPALTIVSLALHFGHQNSWNTEKIQRPFLTSKMRVRVLGMVLLIIGSFIFGNAWEVMEIQSSYLASQERFFNSSPCADFVTACLIEDSAQRSEQVFKAWLAALLWYSGLALWLNSFNNISIDDNISKLK